MKHKYLCELFSELFSENELPFPYGEPDYPDFDERVTFSMNYTLIAWLYECLRYFQEETSKIVNFDWEGALFEIDGENFTQRQCIDRMVEDCKTILLSNEFTDEEYDEMFADKEKLMSMNEEREKQADVAKDDLFKVLSKCFWAMWW